MMGRDYVIVVLPETLNEILLMILILVGISTYVYQWRNERRRKAAIVELEEVNTKFQKLYARKEQSHVQED